jgi:dethiobiotin synthetase
VKQPRGFFIAGTDTGVGKTEVARALLEQLAASGLRPVALKPVETGCAPDAPEDALALRKACGPPGDALELDRVCPYRFELPAAPLVAARGRTIDLGRIEALVREAIGPIVVEAAGGLLVPLTREIAHGSLEQVDAPDRAPVSRMVTNLDLAERLGLPVVLVGRAGLGTLNHCALSAQALLSRGLEVAAIVLNRVAAQDDPTVATNAAILEELTGLRVLGPLPFVASAQARPQALASVVAALASRLFASA